MFVILKPFEERAGKPELSADAVAARLREKFGEVQRGAGGASSARRRSTAWAAPAASSSRCRTAAAPGLRALQGAVQNLADEGNQRPAAGRPVQQLQRQPAAALRRGRPRRRPRPRRSRSTDIDETLQAYLGSVYVNDFTLPEPQLAGERPGRRRATACRSRTSATLEVRNAQGRQGAAADADQGPRRQPARRSSTTTTCTRRPRSTATRRRASAPARPSASWTALAATQLPVDDGLRVDRADLPADPGRQGPAHQAGLPAGGGVRASWCWRPSTRAGRCRWRSS